MKAVWTSRVTQAAARYGEHAPIAATCCNACRTCVQANAMAGLLAALLAVGAGLGRHIGLRRVPVKQRSGAEA